MYRRVDHFVPDVLGVFVTPTTHEGRGEPLCVGYIRRDRVSEGGGWVARLRPGRGSSQVEPVAQLPTRREAAAWLLVQGGFARQAEGVSS